MAILNINGVNYDNNVVVGSYKINATDIYKEWTDANGTDHRHIIRSKVSGSFDMEFRSMSSYESFLGHIKDSKTTQGWIPCYLMVNNLHANKSCKMFFNFTTTLDRKNNNSVDYIPKFTVEVVEA